MSFEEEYWQKLYDDPDSMDGIGNAQDHLNYIKSVFEIEKIPITSIIEFGFGMGVMLEQLVKFYNPYLVVGIEPSKFIYKKLDQDKFQINESIRLKFQNCDLQDFLEKEQAKRKPRVFDLGVCMSVFQYVDNETLESIIPLMARQCHYLYLTVPTNNELKWQEDELDYHDHYALRRSRSYYQKILRKNFTFVSSRILESKHHFDEAETSFSDLLYRF